MMIPYGHQQISDEDIDAVIKTLKSDWLTQGPNIKEFEDAVCDEVCSKFAVSSNSATSSLHIACKALELSKGDLVWTSPNSFVASANAAIYCGAEVDFVDIDPHSYNICVKKLEQKLINAEKNNCLPKIIIPVHYAGQSCDMKEIFRLSKIYEFSIIEDASHAIGAKYENKSIGNCKYSDITVFSFHPVKIITTAEGGMATTNDKKIAEKLRQYRSHGITRDKNSFGEVDNDEIWNYQQISLGFNYRMNDIQASLGLSQLKKVDEFVIKRHEIANFYNTKLNGMGIVLPYQFDNTFSSFHLYPIRISIAKCGINQLRLYKHLREKDIGVNLHYIPIYRHPFFEKRGFKKGYCQEAEKHFREVITLPIYPGLSLENQKYIVESIKEVF